MLTTAMYKQTNNERKREERGGCMREKKKATAADYTSVSTQNPSPKSSATLQKSYKTFPREDRREGARRLVKAPHGKTREAGAVYKTRFHFWHKGDKLELTSKQAENQCFGKVREVDE